MAILYHPFTDPSRVYYGTDTRVATLLLGAALAFVWAPWRLVGRTGRNAGDAARRGRAGEWRSSSAGCSSTSATSIRTSTAAGSSSSRSVSAVLIAATVHPASRSVPRLLAIDVFLWIGVRSYGIYLWHWPIYMVTRPHSDVPLTGIPLLVLRLALTLVAAALSYRFVEEPVRHGALERWWGRFRTSSGETRRKLAAPLRARRGRHHPGPGGDRRRPRRRGERGRPGRARRQDLGDHPARADHHDHRRPRCDDADDRPGHHRAAGHHRCRRPR